MSHLSNIKNAILRYQSTDANLYNVLSEMIDELEQTSVRHLGEDKQEKIGSQYGYGWGPLIRVINHQAADFTMDGGEIWNVIGVATGISRAYKITADNKFMYYTVQIDNSTITTGGIGALAKVKLPPGYRCVGIHSGQSFTGAGHVITLPGIAFESSSVIAFDSQDIIYNVRPAGGFYPGPGAVYGMRFSITLPVEFSGGKSQKP